MNSPKEKGALQSAQSNTTYAANNSTSLQQVEQALTFIDASDSDTWIKCGMAVKSEFGDAGFDAWDIWSSTADNYRARDAATRWKSFKTSGGITIATLFKLAIDSG
jgi:putative DNA primase/helicase